MGMTLAELDRDQESRDAFIQATKIDSRYADAYLLLGVAFDKAKRYNGAIEAYKLAITNNKDLPQARLFLGIDLVKTNQYQQALNEFTQAIRISPDYKEAHFAQALVHLLLGSKNSAIERYNVLKTLDEEMANSLFDIINEN
jgi:tetratricopeptide (TPR) repeat protein